MSIEVPTGNPATSRPPLMMSSIAISSATLRGGWYRARLLPRTINAAWEVGRAEIARGHSRGSYRTQQKILSALNRFEARPREYSFQDLFSSESEPEIGPALPNRRHIIAKGKPLSEEIIEHRR